MKHLLSAAHGRNMEWMAGYISHAPLHYRNFKCYIPATRGERTATYISFFPHDFAVPANNQHDDVARSIRDLTAALNHRYTNSLPQSIGDEQLLAIQKLETIFCTKPKPVTTALPVPVPVLFLPLF